MFAVTDNLCTERVPLQSLRTAVVTLEHRSREIPFSAAAPRSSGAPALAIRATDAVSNSLSLCVFTQMSADSAFDNAPVLKGMHISENRGIGVKVLFFSALRTLFAVVSRQLYYFQSLADSCLTLLHKSEDQVPCFHVRAHDFVDIGGWGQKVGELKWRFSFASHRRHSRYTPPLFTMDKEPQWS